MIHGVTIAMMVSLAWILVQNLWMHVRPANNRFNAMLLGYLLSLPVVMVAYWWLPPLSNSIAESMKTESPLLGLFHAYFLHLLIFLLYAECFYYVERSVTLRLLIEMLKHGSKGAPLSSIQGSYSIDDMIRQRLEVLSNNGFLEQHGNTWRLQPKGARLARFVIVVCWLFQAKFPYERG